MGTGVARPARVDADGGRVRRGGRRASEAGAAARAPGRRPPAARRRRGSWQHDAGRRSSQIAVSAAPDEAGASGARRHGRGFRHPVESIVSGADLSASRCSPTGRSRARARGSFETLMQGLDVGLLGTLPADPLAARARLRAAATEPRRRRRAAAARPERDRDRPRRPGPPDAARRRGARLVSRALRALTSPSARSRTRTGACRWRTPAISCAASCPTGARTCRSPRPSRSAGCSRCRSRRSSPR